MKNQSSSLYNNAWTRKQVWSLSDEQLVTEYNKIKSRCDKDGLGTQKVKLVTDSPKDVNVPIVDQVSLSDTSAGVTTVAASSIG